MAAGRILTRESSTLVATMLTLPAAACSTESSTESTNDWMRLAFSTNHITRS